MNIEHSHLDVSIVRLPLYLRVCFSFSKMDSNNHFNYGTHSSANSGLKLSSGDSLYTNGSSMSFPQQGKSEYIPSWTLSERKDYQDTV